MVLVMRSMPLMPLLLLLAVVTVRVIVKEVRVMKRVTVMGWAWFDLPDVAEDARNRFRLVKHYWGG